jgi:hypothetical protein
MTLVTPLRYECISYLTHNMNDISGFHDHPWFQTLIITDPSERKDIVRTLHVPCSQDTASSHVISLRTSGNPVGHRNASAERRNESCHALESKLVAAKQDSRETV